MSPSDADMRSTSGPGARTGRDAKSANSSQPLGVLKAVALSSAEPRRGADHILSKFVHLHPKIIASSLRLGAKRGGIDSDMPKRKTGWRKRELTRRGQKNSYVVVMCPRAYRQEARSTSRWI